MTHERNLSPALSPQKLYLTTLVGGILSTKIGGFYSLFGFIRLLLFLFTFSTVCKSDSNQPIRGEKKTLESECCLSSLSSMLEKYVQLNMKYAENVCEIIVSSVCRAPLLCLSAMQGHSLQLLLANALCEKRKCMCQNPCFGSVGYHIC